MPASDRRNAQVRLVGDLKVACPAGAPIGETIRGSGVRCRIEHSTISSCGSGATLASYCLNAGAIGSADTGYRGCPTWVAMREAEEAGRVEAEKLARELKVDSYGT